MRLCFITNNIAEKGGVQRVLSVLANKLSQQHKVDILMTSPRRIAAHHSYHISDQVNIIIDDSFYKARQRSKIHRAIGYINKKLYRIKSRTILQKIFFPLFEMKVYNDFFQNNYYDAIIGVQPRAAGIVSLLNTSSQRIGWMHNTYNAYFNLPGKYQWRQDFLYKKLLGQLDKLIVLTDYDINLYSKQFELNNVYRIYNPLSFKSKTKSSLNNNRIAFVGRLLYEQKGLGLLIDIAKKIIVQRPNIVFDIIGDGADKQYFKNKIEENSLLSYFHFIGMVDCVQDHLIKDDLFVLTSKYEGFGLVVTEAMECGLPVVSFSTEGPSEIIQNGLNGFLVKKYNTEEFAKKVILLLEKPEIRKSMGLAAQRRARDFSEDTICREWTNLLSNAKY